MNGIMPLDGTIKTVYVGINGPHIFFKAESGTSGRKKLELIGLEVGFVEGLGNEILKLSKLGHGDCKDKSQ